MRPDSRLLTLNEVSHTTVTRVSDDRSNRLVGDIFMSLNESKQASSFVDRPGGGLYGGNNLMSIIDHPMTLVARPTFESTLAHQGCIRIAGTAKLAVSLVSSASWALGARTSSSRVRRRLVVLFVLWLIELLDLLPRGLVNGSDHLRLQRRD